MIVKLFQERFAELVRSGQKKQTIRPWPKTRVFREAHGEYRLPKVGDKISLRRWTGKPYRSKQEVLRGAIITEVSPIEFRGDCQCLLKTVKIGDRFLTWDDVILLALADGFETTTGMADWFHEAYGLPFTGILIKWL